MGAKIHHRSTAVLVEPAPVEILLGVGVAILRKDRLLRRTLHREERSKRTVPLCIRRGHAAKHVRNDVLKTVTVARI